MNLESIIKDFSQMAERRSELLNEMPLNIKALQDLDICNRSKIQILLKDSIKDAIDCSIKDAIEDAMLCTDPMPEGYIVTVIDSTYSTIYGLYITIIHIKHEQNEQHEFMSVHTLRKCMIGTRH